MTRYDDILNLPHWEPKNHPRMGRLERAAQFSPFAALSGYDEVPQASPEQAFTFRGICPLCGKDLTAGPCGCDPREIRAVLASLAETVEE